MARYEWAILGAGALGSVIGAHLSRSGHQVVMLARGQRAQDIEKDGVRIKGLQDFTERVHVLTDPSQFQGADVFVVATKTHGTEAALEPYRHARIGTAFSDEPGMDPSPIGNALVSLCPLAETRVLRVGSSAVWVGTPAAIPRSRPAALHVKR